MVDVTVWWKLQLRCRYGCVDIYAVWDGQTAFRRTDQPMSGGSVVAPQPPECRCRDVLEHISRDVLEHPSDYEPYPYGLDGCYAWNHT